MKKSLQKMFYWGFKDVFLSENFQVSNFAFKKLTFKNFFFLKLEIFSRNTDTRKLYLKKF